MGSGSYQGGHQRSASPLLLLREVVFLALLGGDLLMRAGGFHVALPDIPVIVAFGRLSVQIGEGVGRGRGFRDRVGPLRLGFVHAVLFTRRNLVHLLVESREPVIRGRCLARGASSEKEDTEGEPPPIHPTILFVLGR